jgi:hypothetical protein
MRTLNGLLAFILLIAAWPATAMAQPATSPSNPMGNAALQYWQAFAQMPALDEEQEKLLDEWRTVSLDDPAVHKLVADSQKSILYLRRGAHCSHCDWGLDYNDGISMLLPHLAKSRSLARLAALDARYQFERGNRNALTANAFAMMNMARHVGRDPTMVCLLVRFLIEGLVVDVMAPYLPATTMPYAKAVTMFKALPEAPDLQQIIAAEKKYFLEWMIRKLREEEEREPGAGVKLWQNMLGAEGPQELKQVASLGAMVNLLEDLLSADDELQKLVALPKPKFDEQYPQFKKRVAEEKPLVRFLLPDIAELLAKQQRNETRMAMLLASVAVVESGPEALKDIKDPFGDGPFEYRAFDKGFELKSKLTYENKPVTLTVGQPATK